MQPVECLGCGLPDRALCPACRVAIRPARARPVRCDAPLAVAVWTAADYAGPVREAILSLKEHGRVDAAKPLAPLLAAAIASAAHAGGGRLELVRVPTTRRALLRRGHDPLGELLRAARLPSSSVLRPVATWRATAQKTKGRGGRLQGDHGRFRARADLRGRRFLLLDDVVTTGATLAAAASAIVSAGGEVVGCAALAAPDLARRGLADPRMPKPRPALAVDSVTDP